MPTEVGPHTGWAVSYFPTAAPGPLPNLWGSGQHPVPDGAGGFTDIVSAADRPDDRDFDLGPWLDAGRLLWVAPGDPDVRLRTGRDGCPYLDLAGRREDAVIRDGVVSRAIA